MTIVDYTPSGWPVFAAAISWDAAPRIDIVYRYGSCGPLGHCIGVRLTSTWPYTCAQSGGYAVVRPMSASNSHIDPDTSYIRVNDRCGGSSWTNRDRQALACEEDRVARWPAGRVPPAPPARHRQSQWSGGSPTGSKHGASPWLELPSRKSMCSISFSNRPS